MTLLLLAHLGRLLAQAAPAAQQGTDDSGHPGWALATLAVAIMLFFLEVFIPSGGLLALLSAIALVAGIVLMFGVSTTWGLASIIVVLLALPLGLVMMIKLWPSTPIARMLTLGEPEPDESLSATAAKGETREPDPLVGKEGKAITDMRPVGTVLVDGRREVCLAEGGLIQAGTAVRVVSVDGMETKVRPVTASLVNRRR